MYFTFLGSQLLHPIGIGTFGMGGGNLPFQAGEVFATPYRDDQDLEQQVKALRHSFTQGQTFVDTAAMYGLGRSEEIVGQAIRGYQRCRLLVASKIDRQALQQPSTMTAAAHASLVRLGLEHSHLDLMSIHSPNYPGTVMEAHMPALNRLVDLGLTRAIGLCNVSLAQLRQAIALSWHPIAAVQNLYNPLYHQEGGNKATFTPELQDFCRQHGILMVAHTPLHAGHVARHPILRRLAHQTGRTATQLTLAWIRLQGILPIPKASQLHHIDENVQAADLPLSPTLLRQIDRLPAEGLPERGITAPVHRYQEVV